MTTLWINQAWPVMFDSVGHNACWILVGINCIGLAALVFFWPETKGISLEQMDKLFGELTESRPGVESAKPVLQMLAWESLNTTRRTSPMLFKGSGPCPSVHY